MALILCLCPIKHILSFASFLKLSLAHLNVVGAVFVVVVVFFLWTQCLNSRVTLILLVGLPSLSSLTIPCLVPLHHYIWTLCFLAALITVVGGGGGVQHFKNTTCMCHWGQGVIISRSFPACPLKMPSCLSYCFRHLYQFKISLPVMAVFFPLRARNDSNHPPLIPFPLCRLCKLSASFLCALLLPTRSK